MNEHTRPCSMLTSTAQLPPLHTQQARACAGFSTKGAGGSATTQISNAEQLPSFREMIDSCTKCEPSPVPARHRRGQSSSLHWPTSASQTLRSSSTIITARPMMPSFTTSKYLNPLTSPHIRSISWPKSIIGCSDHRTCDGLDTTFAVRSLISFCHIEECCSRE